MFFSGATEFKEKFDECVKSLKNATTNGDKLADDISSLKVEDEKNASRNENSDDNSSKPKTDSKDDDSKDDDLKSQSIETPKD